MAEKYESLDDLIAAFNLTSDKPFVQRQARRRESDRARDEWAERAPSWPTMREARASARWRRQTSVWRAQKVAEDTLVVREGEPEAPIERTLLEWMLRSAEQNPGTMRTLRDMGSPKLAMKAGKADDPEAVAKLAARMIAEIDERARLFIQQPKPRKTK